MNTPAQIAKQIRGVYFGGNWTTSSMKDNLADVSWQQATTQVYSFNTIATLVYHTSYYISIVTKVLLGEPLSGNDKDSFNVPPIQKQEEWENLLNKTFTEAETFATLVEQIPESRLDEIFINEKYGTWYRNLHGIIEHTHYHLGQIALIKKILQQQDNRLTR